MASKVILIEASPRRAADGVAETVRLAGGGGQFAYYYGGNHYRAGVVQLPTIVTAITFDGGDFGAGGVPQAAELQWAASRKADLAAIANYFWIDAPITVRIGDENSAGTLPAVTITGKVLSATVDGGVVKLQLSDPAADLKKPLLTARFGGTGGVDGPAEWDGRIKTRVWGRVWNLEGELIDRANNVYCWADPARPIQSFDALRDKGAPAAAINVLAWQGSVAATFAALQAAVAPQGGGVACPSIACVKWWTQPAGALTADLKGEVGAGYVETTAQIVQQLVKAGPNTPFTAGTIAAAQAARSAPVGWVAKDDSTGVASMIEELLGNSSLLWLLNASGEIVIREWAWGAGVASGVSQSVKRTSVFAPVGTRKLGFKRNETQMARGDLAAIVLVSDVVYGDGTPLSQAVSDAYALAASRGKVWTTPAMPSVAESNPGDTWIAADGTFYDRVNDGGILLGGFAITLGGFRPRIAWTLAANQVLRDVLAQADAAYTSANDAIDQLIDLASDGVLSRNEKITKLVPESARLADKWASLSAIATSLAVSTATASGARTAWLAFLAALAPAWNDTSQDTTVSRAAFDAARDAYDTALYELDRAIKAKAATVATWAGVTGTGGQPTGNDVAATISPGGGIAANQVNTQSVVSGALSGTTIVSGSGSSAPFAAVRELAYMTIPTLDAGTVGIRLGLYGQIKDVGSGYTPGYPMLRLYRISAANAAAYISSIPRNPSILGVPMNRNKTLPNWSNIDMGGTLLFNTTTPAAGDLYVLGIDVVTYPPGAGSWSYNWRADIALDIVKR